MAGSISIWLLFRRASVPDTSQDSGRDIGLERDPMDYASRQRRGCLQYSSCLEQVLHDEQCYNHHCIFVGGSLSEQITTPIDPSIEYDEAVRMEYIMKYMSSIPKAAATTI